MEEAAQELRAALAGAAARYGHHASGVVRWEVPLPRGATALQWLQVALSVFSPSSGFSAACKILIHIVWRHTPAVAQVRRTNVR